MKIDKGRRMTFRQWTNVYGGTYATIMLVATGAAIVVTGEVAAHPLWLHLLIGLPLFFIVQFTLSVLAWQFTAAQKETWRRQPDAVEVTS